MSSRTEEGLPTQRFMLSKPIRLRLAGNFQRSNSDKLVHQMPEILNGTLNGRCVTFKRLGVGAHRAVYACVAFPRIVFKFTQKQRGNIVEAEMAKLLPQFVTNSTLWGSCTFGSTILSPSLHDS